MMTKRLLVWIPAVMLVLLISCSGNGGGSAPGDANPGKVMNMTDAIFRQEVFNYETHKKWKLAGRKPVIIDFYADWCKPCLAMSPLLDEIAVEYSGKLVVYKVDTEKEELLAKKLGIRSLPTLMFIPVKGTPQLIRGGMPKDSIVKAVHEILLVK
jgi:thioredoxin